MPRVGERLNQYNVCMSPIMLQPFNIKLFVDVNLKSFVFRRHYLPFARKRRQFSTNESLVCYRLACDKDELKECYRKMERVVKKPLNEC